MPNRSSRSLPTTAEARDRASASARAAWALRLDGRYQDAADRYDAALSRATDELDPDDPALVELLNGAGVLAKYAGRFDDAAASYRRALEIATVADAPDQQVLASLLHNVGGLEHARGNHVAAADAARRGLAYQVAVLGADHPLVAADRAALAAIELDLGHLDEASTLASAALDVYRQARERGEPWGSPEACAHDELAALAVLAAARHRLGDLERAEATYREVLDHKRTHLGPSHPELVPTLNNLGVLLAERGELDAAADAYRDALDLLGAAGLGDHRQAAGLRRNIDALDDRRGG
jgi:tetratricopeptide (TPR) repeat protein